MAGLFSAYTGAPASPGVAPAPQGLLDLFLGSQNPISQFVDNRQNTIGTIGAGLASGPTFAQGLANAAQNVPQARKSDYAQNLYRGQISQTIKYLHDAGYQDIEAGVTSGAYTPQQGMQMASERQYRPPQVMTPGSYMGNGLTGAPLDPNVNASASAGGAAVGQPYQGTDANGKPAMLISTSFGAPRVLGPIGGDTNSGTASGMTIQDPNIGLQKNALSTAQGQNQAAAQAQLPAMSQTIALTNQAIELLKNDKQGLAETFGKVGPIPQQIISGIPYLGTPMPGSAKAKFQTELAQATGQQFLQARQSLKGGGSITDYEGNKAESAYARMSTATDQESFLKAADDFQAAANAGYAKLKAVAAGNYDPNKDYGLGSQTANYQKASSMPDIQSLLDKYK